MTNLSKDIILKNGFEIYEDKILKTMSIENGFKYEEYHQCINEKFNIIITLGISNMIGREYSVHIDDDYYETIANADIQTVEHFNQLMKLMDINFEMVAD